MENKEGTNGKEFCLKGKCCGGKTLAAVMLLAIGGLGGYFCSRNCPVKDAPAAQATAK